MINYDEFSQEATCLTLTESKHIYCFILYFEYKNVFNASDLIFTGDKCHMLLFIKQGILSEMFYFRLLEKKVMTFTTSEY